MTDGNNAEAGKGGGEGNSSPQKTEQTVPLAALLAERDEKRSFKSEVENLRKEIEALKQKPAKEYSRTELQQLVDDGRMSQSDADRIYDQQTTRKIEESVAQKITTHLDESRLKATLESEIARYTTAVPDALVEGTETRELLKREYARQRSLGKPDNLQTELDALSAVFGPPDRLRAGRDKQLQTHQDGDSDGGNSGDAGSSGAPKLPANVKAHYEKLIGMRQYTGWDDPKLQKELETYKRPGW